MSIAVVKQEPVQLLHLTSLRFFAALAVLFFHQGYLKSLDNPLKDFAVIFFNEGYSGVSFFFVLSGFILGYSYQKNIKSKTISVKKYLLLRLSRIFPLHLFTAFIFILFLFLANKLSIDFLKSTLLNLLLLQSWVSSPNYYFSLNAVSWSLSVELFFYFSFILLVGCSTKTLIRLALVLLILIVTLAAYIIFKGGGSWTAENGDLKLSHWVFYINPIVRSLDFITGLLIYRISFTKVYKKYSSFNEIFSIFLLFLGTYIFSAYQFPEILRSQLLYLPLIAYVIYSFANGEGILSKRLKGKNLVLLGEASFVLYMIHQPIITIAFENYKKLFPTIPIIIFSIIITVVCIFTSVLIYKVVEKPIHDYLKQKIRAAT
jgi:peptidoglycan/LPS O-acetylase OafA/YrhL